VPLSKGLGVPGCQRDKAGRVRHLLHFVRYLSLCSHGDQYQLPQAHGVVGPIATERNDFTATASASHSGLDIVLLTYGLQRDLTFSLGILSFAAIISTVPQLSALTRDTVMPRLWSSETVLMASSLGPSVSPNTASKLESRDKQKTVRLFERKNCTSG
jgi:hypothetical protein